MLLEALDDCDDIITIGARSGIEGLAVACGAGSEAWKLRWYGALISQHLELTLKAALGKPGGVALGAISVPPGEGKSWRAASFLPARGLGLDPHLQVMCGAYGRELAVRNLARTRQVMSAAPYLAAYGTRIGSTAEVEPRRAKGERPRRVRSEERSQIFRTLYQTQDGALAQADGYYLSTALAAGATGWRYHLGVVDDLVKDAQNATPRALEKQREWYGKAFLTRGHKDRSALVLIGTRWSPDDLIGTEVERWRKAGLAHYSIELPALRDVEDATGLDPRGIGEWLDVDAAAKYETIRKILPDPGDWEALYQQRPQRAGGGMIRREDFGRYDPADLARLDLEQAFTSWDPAQKPTGRSRYAGAVWGVHRGRLYCLERVTGHFDYDEWEREVMRLAKAWPAATVHLIEDTAAGAIFHQRKRRELAGLTKAEHPTKDKETRTTAQLPHYRGRRVLLPSRTYGRISDEWVEPLLIEAVRFPAPPNDQVDEVTQAIAWADSRGLLR